MNAQKTIVINVCTKCLYDSTELAGKFIHTTQIGNQLSTIEAEFNNILFVCFIFAALLIRVYENVYYDENGSQVK